MSIFKVNQTDFQSITIATNPSKYYSSSSSGITGSVYVFPRRSSIEKDISSVDNLSTSFNESALFNSWNDKKNNAFQEGSLLLKQNIFSSFFNFTDGNGFLKEVNNKATSKKKQKTLEILRFTPPYYFTTETLKKLIIKDNLSHYYRTTYPSAHWAYSNYHSLNFFSIVSSKEIKWPRTRAKGRLRSSSSSRRASSATTRC